VRAKLPFVSICALAPMYIAAYLPGIYPRSEGLVTATRDLDRDRTTAQAVDRRFGEERAKVISLQQDAGLDLFSDGLLRWQDIFRPLADASEGLDARTLVRWFDNNSFFRAPHVTGRPRLGRVPDVLEEDPPPPDPKVATLPSPYLFSRAAQANGDRDGLLRALAADVLAPAARDLAGRGYRLIHLQEPWLGFFGIDEGAWPAFQDAVGAIREAAPDVTLTLHVSFGDASPYADRLRALPVDAVGVDFVETDLDALLGPWGTGLVAGCLDGRRSVMETVDGTAAFVRQVAERLEPEALYVAPNAELELLGAEVADRKVRLLGRVAARAKEVLAA
jgi:5-methyltetrahydropteroyltriglutamate--homocysteine methyltransferase